MTTPAISQVHVQVNRDIQTARPWPDGVWVPGHYRYEGNRRVWVAGRWRHENERPVYVRHDNGRHLGWYKGKGHGKHGRGNDNNDRNENNDHNDNGKDHGKEK